MALIKCPECNNQISDKATVCIHCGCPNEFFNTNASISTPKVEKAVKKANTKPKNRRMKLPNGFGSIKKLSGNRRKPFAAYPPMRKHEMDDDGKFPTKKALGFYKTYQEAYECLLQYSNMPFDEKLSQVTFKELYDKYLSSDDFLKLKEKSQTSRMSAYKYCEPIYNYPVRNITKQNCLDIIDAIDKGSATKKNVLTCMKTVSTMALDMNLIVKDFTFNISIAGEDAKIDRIPFTKNEIKILWQNKDKWDYKVMLMLLYSGMRVNELLKNKISNVNLEEKWIYIDDAKNKSSIRYVPIHDDVLEFFKYFVDNANKNNTDRLMVKENGAKIMYNNFVSRQLPSINKMMECEHKFHDTRHTFSTQCVICGIDQLYIQKILGHAPENILQKTYLHITLDELRESMNQFNYKL